MAGVLRAMSARRSLASPVYRGAATFIPLSRLDGCGVTGWLDGVEPLYSAELFLYLGTLVRVRRVLET